MYRAGMEEILGLRLTGTSLQLDPCIPERWPGFQVTLRRGATRFDVRVDNPKSVAKGIASATIDGNEVTVRPLRIDLPEDGATHEIRVTMG
jgi:cyclic beta-1,2-glucan synthetase